MPFLSLRKGRKLLLQHKHISLTMKRKHHEDMGTDHLVVIKAEGVETAVPRLRLIEESPVFKAMLESGMTEASENIVCIPDFSLGTVKSFAEWLPMEGVYFTPDVGLPEMFQFACKYEVTKLKSLCESIMCNTSYITKESVVSLLVMADSHCCASLKFTAMDFLMNNVRIDEIDKLLSELNPELLTDYALYATKKYHMKGVSVTERLEKHLIEWSQVVVDISEAPETVVIGRYVFHSTEKCKSRRGEIIESGIFHRVGRDGDSYHISKCGRMWSISGVYAVYDDSASIVPPSIGWMDGDGGGKEDPGVVCTVKVVDAAGNEI